MQALRGKYRFHAIGAIWSAVAFCWAIVAWVNWTMPHGPFYQTGEYLESDSGQSGWEVKERVDLAPIPRWAKEVRWNEDLLTLGGLVAGFVFTIPFVKKEPEDTVDRWRRLTRCGRAAGVT